VPSGFRNTAARLYGRVRHGSLRRGLDFDSLADRPRLLLDMRAVAAVDEPTTTAGYEPVTDAAGRTSYWIRYRSHDPVTGAAPFPEMHATGGPAIVAGPSGWVIADQGWLVPATWYRGTTFLPPALRPGRPVRWVRCPERRRLAGRTLNALTEFSGVYGHALWEAVYKVLAHYDARGGFDDVDHVLVPTLAARLLDRFSPEIREALGGKARLVFYPKTRFVCDDVVVVRHPACCKTVSPRQVALLRDHVADRPGPRPARVYLRRPPGGSREIANDAEVARTFAEAGFAVVDPGAVDGLYGLMREAQVVAGVHGSNLADVVFMSPGATLLELTPTDHVQPYFRNAAEVAGVRYVNLFCRSRRTRLRPAGPSDDPVAVDCDALRRVLAAIG